MVFFKWDAHLVQNNRMRRAEEMDLKVGWSEVEWGGVEWSGEEWWLKEP